MPKKPCAFSGCHVLIEAGTRYCDRHAAKTAGEDQAREWIARKDRPSRKWYNSAAWRGPKGRRAAQLAAEPLCRMCPDWSRQPATVADHVIPHRDNHALFWFGALQSLCKPCHDIKKQREERRGGCP